MKKLLIIFALLIPFTVSATTVLFPIGGGTGTSTTPKLGNLLIGNQLGIYGVGSLVAGNNITLTTATNSITIAASTGANAFGTTSISALAPLVWSTSNAQLTTNFSTSTANTYSSLQIFNAQAGVGTSTPAATLGVQGNLLLSGSITSSNITASGTVTATSLSLTNALTVGNGGTGSTTLGGILLGNGAALSATGTVATAWGGTGDQSFNFGELLVGNSNGNLTSTTTTNLKASMHLNLVENTALSTWAGSSNLTTLGTITSGTWNGSTIAVANGGTGQTSFTGGQLLYGNSTAALSSVATATLSCTGAVSCTSTNVIGTASSINLASIIPNSVLGNSGSSNAVPAAFATSSLGVALGDTTGTLAVNRGGTGSTTLGNLLVGAGLSINSTSTVSANNGGTGNSTYAVGDLLYASTANVLTRLAISGTAGQVLSVSGGLPAWVSTSSGAVTSVSNSDSSLTISPTTGAVVASLNVGNANTWTAKQTFANASTTNISSTQGAEFATSGGQVGIGTTSPIDKLDVYNGIIRLADTSTIHNFVYFDFNDLTIDENNSNSTERLRYSLNGSGNTGCCGKDVWDVGINQTNSLDFSITRGGGLTVTDFLMSSSTGNVGLGTSTPATTLSVQGNSLISGTTTTANLVATGTVNFSVATVTLDVYPTFTYSTSTAWTGTTTLLLGTNFVKETWESAICRTDAGTLNVQPYDSSLLMTMIAASTGSSTVAITSNNALPPSTNRKVDVGTPASSPTVISCTFDIQRNK